jgi:hypothetical protein
MSHDGLSAAACWPLQLANVMFGCPMVRISSAMCSVAYALIIVSYLLEGRGYRYFLRRDLARYEVKPVFEGRSFATKFSLRVKFLLDVCREGTSSCRTGMSILSHGQSAHGTT